MFSCSTNAQVTLMGTTIENDIFFLIKKKDWIYDLYLIRQSFEGYLVNRALPSLHLESLKITLTVPFRHIKERQLELKVFFII